MVVTPVAFKDRNWLTSVLRGYRDMLEREEYEFFMLPGMKLNGMALDDETLEYIYRKNFLRIFGAPAAIGED